LKQPIIELQGIEKSYAAENKKDEPMKILDHLDLRVYKGQFIAIRGESGCGKTTLLRIIGLIDKDYQGVYRFAGDELHTNSKIIPWNIQEEIRATNIGFIFQEDRLLEHLDIKTNIELPMFIHNFPKEKRIAKLKELTEKVYTKKEIDKDKILNRKRSKLSSGQRQRSAVIRPIAHSPAFILADEPTANLDPGRKQEIVKIMKQLCNEGHTIIVVSHDTVFEQADVVYELKDGRLHEFQKTRIIDTSVQPAQTTHPKTTMLTNEASVASKENSELKSLKTKSALFLKFKYLMPRSPRQLHLKLASKDLFRNVMFTLLIIGALIIGSFQATIFLSLHSGTNKLLDDIIRTGSRLTRISIPTKDITATKRFPDIEQIKKIPGVSRVEFRREGIYRVKDRRGRDRFETLFGLHNHDPEYEQLVFTAGGRFSSINGLEVIISERSIKRLFDVPGDVVSDDFRNSLIGKQIKFVIARPKIAGASLSQFNENIAKDEFNFKLKLVGIVAQAEAGRNFYFPQHVQLILEKWRLDETRKFIIPLNKSRNEWSINIKDIKEMIDFSWIERAHVYLDTIDKVIPAYTRLTAMGYEPYSSIFEYRWVIDTRYLARYLLVGLVLLAVIIGMMNIANNIITSIKIRQKEIVLLKLLGMRGGDISAIYMWNAIIASVIGTVIGFILGTLSASGVSGFLSTRYADASFAKIFAPTWPFFIIIVLTGIILAIIASIIPAYRAGQIDLVGGFES
jgi:ABC-type lipoprotein export system ATPase subunit/cell division protein FtsX